MPMFVDLQTSQGVMKVNPRYVTAIGPDTGGREPSTLVRILGRDETLKVAGTAAEVETVLRGGSRREPHLRSLD